MKYIIIYIYIYSTLFETVSRTKSLFDTKKGKERKEKKRRTTGTRYKKGGYDSVMFVPATPGSVLMKKYKNEVQKSGIKIRIVEKAGISLKQQLQRSDPFKLFDLVP